MHVEFSFSLRYSVPFDNNVYAYIAKQLFAKVPVELPVKFGSSL